MKTYYYKLTVFIVFFFISTSIFSQVLITDDGTTTSPDNSAILEIKSNSKGMLIPRLTTIQRNTLTTNAVPGILVFDLDLGSFFIYGKTAKGIDGWVDLSSGGTIWEKAGNNIYLANTNYNVGIGTNTPSKKFVIKAENQNDTLFEILDSYGKPLMIITPTLSKFYFNENNTKGVAGGFAVGRYASAKSVSDTALFLVTPDSTRVYTSGAAAKGVAGGFAVGRYASAKASPIQYFNTNISSTRVYTDGSAKGVAGGFAVGRYASAKGENTYKYFFTDIDSTRIYTDGSGVKGVAGGFAVGRYASAKVTKGSYMYMIPDNYFIGDSSGLSFQQNPTLTGRYNTFFGYKTGMVNEVGSRNVLLGYEAGINIKNGSDNVLLGYQAGHEVITAGNNISIGSQAGYFNTNNSDNIFLGRQAGYNHTGDGVTVNSAINNIYIGLNAGYGDLTYGNRGSNNIFLGSDAGKNNYTGINNVFLGFQAGLKNTEGENNVLLGSSAGENNETGDNNIFIGKSAGSKNISGLKNIYIGFEAGKNATGNGNVMIGEGVGNSVTTGGANTLYGQLAGASLTTGNQNVFIGPNAGNSISDGSGNVCIGYKAGINETGSNKLYISNWGTTTTLIYGEFRPSDNNGYVQINKRLNVAGEFTFPSVDGATNQVMKTDGLGNLSWVDANSIVNGDNLGNHSATLDLDMNNHSIIDVNDVIINAGNYVGVGSASERIYFDGTNNEIEILGAEVGIGTTEPEAPLDIETNSSGYAIHLEETDTGTEDWQIGVDAYGDLNFFDGLVSRITFEDNTGDIGIGTDAPAHNIDIFENINTTSPMIRLYQSDISGDASAIFQTNGGNAFTIGIDASDSDKFKISDYTSLGYYDRFVINSIGDVGIGTNTPDYKFEVEGYKAGSSVGDNRFISMFKNTGGVNSDGIKVQAGGTDASTTGDVIYMYCADGDGTWVGSIYSTNGTLAMNGKSASYSKGSDIKISENGLNIINELEVVDYDFNLKNNTYKTGFVGEDVLKVFPAMVSYEKKSNEYGISNSILVPILTKGIQEQQIQIEELKNEIKELKIQTNKIIQLESIVKELKDQLNNN